jgi:hypothetical protein
MKREEKLTEESRRGEAMRGEEKIGGERSLSVLYVNLSRAPRVK